MIEKRNNRIIGAKKEQLAATYLVEQGVQMLATNFRSKSGEIDLVGQEGDYLVFFEVKYRSTIYSGYPAEAVGYAKQKQICKTADYYRIRFGIPENVGMRFDVISIQGQTINWIKNAFYYVR